MDKILTLPQEIMEVQQSISQVLIEYLEAEKQLYKTIEQDCKQFDNKVDMLNYAFLHTDTLKQYKTAALIIEKITQNNN